MKKDRPEVRGKFLFVGTEKIHVRGPTYGAFRPDADGNEYHDLAVVNRDFALMAANGFNAVRIPHTMPPRGLLDVAHSHGLRVMVGLSAEQYVGFLIDSKQKDAPDIEALIRSRVRECAGHPALLCYALGNEIPASLVRWLGARRVEKYLEALYHAVKEEDPGGLVTYVNYPTTEYLQLPFLDLIAANVYLEAPGAFRSYLARLHNIAGDRPLLMSELGLDAMRNGELEQAKALTWQIRATMAAGCAGVFIFSWTDEWYRGGEEVHDWAFGLTDGERQPKLALSAVKRAFADGLPSVGFPRISVVLCSHDGSRTIRESCEGLVRLDYPDFEVIVVDDGSSDDTAAIAREYDFRVISTPHRGLSHARNTGCAAATGEIIAYIDDDAYPDSDWLTHLAIAFSGADYVGVGGPNISPPDDAPVAQCVANAPGNPAHVLLTDVEAEHIPGCNMAFRKAALDEIGGFDPQFRSAGDDVDVCWRLRDNGGTLGFSPAAVVWHHRRASLRAYLKQQIGYGRAETALAWKWKDRRSEIGQFEWHGTIYGAGHARVLSFRKPRVYHGIWGNAPFQSIYQPAPSALLSLLLLPEFHLVLPLLAAISALGAFWPPLGLAAVPLFVFLAALVGQAVSSASRSSLPKAPCSRLTRLRWLAFTSLLHFSQPFARLFGRLRAASSNHAQTDWSFAWPGPGRWMHWSEDWLDPMLRLEVLEAALRQESGAVLRGGPHDHWDLEVRGGAFGTVRGVMAVEDHGSGTQLVRFRTAPQVAGAPLCLFVGTSLVAALAGVNEAVAASFVLALSSATMAGFALMACARAKAAFIRALEETGLAGGAEVG